MRKIVSTSFITLDGVVESPDKWSFEYWNDGIAGVMGAQMGAADALLLGRVTYQGFAAAWPQMTDDPGADFMNNSPKYVVSNTLEKAEWNNSTIINGDLPKEIAALKATSGKDILISGSPTLARSLLQLGLVDDLHLLVYPVVLGSGKRLFEGITEKTPVQLVSSKAFDNGVLHLVYQPAQA